MSQAENQTAQQEVLATDLNAPAMLSNIFRVRADRLHAIVDFGYALPVVPSEEALLDEQQVDVHSRVVMPYQLVLQLIERLQHTVDAAREAGAYIPE